MKQEIVNQCFISFVASEQQQQKALFSNACFCCNNMSRTSCCRWFIPHQFKNLKGVAWLRFNQNVRRNDESESSSSSDITHGLRQHVIVKCIAIDRGSFGGTRGVALTRWKHADFCVGNCRAFCQPMQLLLNLGKHRAFSPAPPAHLPAAKSRQTLGILPAHAAAAKSRQTLGIFTSPCSCC